jgi:hypothetical protein
MHMRAATHVDTLVDDNPAASGRKKFKNQPNGLDFVTIKTFPVISSCKIV